MPAGASTVLGLSVAELTLRADRVVRAQVRAVETRTEGVRAYTYTRLGVLADLRGEGAGEVIVRQLGGTVGGVRTVVAGDAVFTPGDEVVAFLRRNPDGEPFHHVVGLGQGVFKVRLDPAGPVAVRDLTGLAVARAGTDGTRSLAPGLPTVMSLEALLDAVRAAQRR